MTLTLLVDADELPMGGRNMRLGQQQGRVHFTKQARVPMAHLELEQLNGPGGPSRVAQVWSGLCLPDTDSV